MTFTLQQADSHEFARWWAVYRNTSEDFSQSFAEQYADIENVPFCHWMMQDGRRVGGLIRVKDRIGDCFFIPPFQDVFGALKAVTGDIQQAQGILSEHVEAFQMLGFTIHESRRWMIRPTQRYSVSFDLNRASPEVHQSSELAELFRVAFTTGSYGRRSRDQHEQSINNYFEQVNSVCLQASSVLIDNGHIVAACLVQPYKSLASIRFVVTHPDYQRRGLGTRMMQYAIDTIHADYPFVALAVTVGNPAQALYYAMGFVPGAVMHDLERTSV
jgi:ribosomal protein S18 acetylase RimI-like enzyme